MLNFKYVEAQLKIEIKNSFGKRGHKQYDIIFS